jgi:hypothetical protein
MVFYSVLLEGRCIRIEMLSCQYKASVASSKRKTMIVPGAFVTDKSQVRSGEK